MRTRLWGHRYEIYYKTRYWELIHYGEQVYGWEYLIHYGNMHAVVGNEAIRDMLVVEGRKK